MRESISLKGSTLLHGANFVAQNRDRSSHAPERPAKSLPWSSNGSKASLDKMLYNATLHDVRLFSSEHRSRELAAYSEGYDESSV